MKVLQINCVYNFGSTGKIVYDIHTALKNKGIESVVCYGRGANVDEPNVYKVSTELGGKVHSVFSRLFGVDFGFSPLATAKTIRIIKKEQPDVVHLHCLNGHFINVYKLVEFLKKSGIKTVLTLHAEIMHTAGCEHAMDCEKWKTECSECPKIRGHISRFFRDDAKYCFNKMKKAFKGFDNLTVVGVSEWLTNRAKQSPIFKDCHFTTVHNGVDTTVFKYIESNIRERLGIGGDEKVILHVTPDFNHPIKGGKYVLELAEKLSEYRFLIVGKGTEGKAFPDNVITLSHTTDKKELAELYSTADVTLLTSSRETFSMVAAESLCCGTKVAGFKAGGPESIFTEDTEFCEYGDIDGICKIVLKIIDDYNYERKVSNFSTEKYSLTKMCESYFNLY